VICATGTYSTGYQTSCTNCPDTQFCSLTGVSGTCGEGWYSPSGKSACLLCPHGSYCTGGQIYTTPTYYYSEDGWNTYYITPDGYGADTTKKSKGTKCAAGYYADWSTNYACTLCTQGYYCYPNGNGVYTSSTRAYCGQTYYCPTGTSTSTAGPSYSSPPACPPWYDC